ncbi:MAG: hypothetical protein M1831_002112 [Alyxoria varia]|nr:MAG: hypothetical protein M1831_002112 [Alyxoria varia]
MSSSNALTKRASSSDDTALMPPPPPPQRIKRPPKVLEEDIYTSALSHIIARDYFPGLLEVEAQQDFLDALDAGDGEWIEEAGRRVKQVMTPTHSSSSGTGRSTPRRGGNMTPRSSFSSETPKGWSGHTPAGTMTPSSSVAASEVARSDDLPGVNTMSEGVNANLNLTNFQARYTSEDNESFNKIVDKQNRKRAERYAWLWNNNKIPSNRQIAQSARKQQRLIADSGHASNSSSSIVVHQNGGSKAAKQSQALVPRPSQNPEDRPAMIDTARAPRAPRNSLMFTPDDLSHTYPHLQSVAQTAQGRSKAAPKAVSYANTRFGVTSSSASEEEESVPPSPSISAIDAAIRGGMKSSHPSFATSTADGDDEEEEEGNQTPRVNGYTFVDADPEPSELDVAEDRHRNEEASDPDDVLTQMLKARDDASGGGDPDGSRSGHNPFSMRPSSRRENLHNAMVEKSLKAKRAPPKNSRLQELQGGAAGKTPTPKFASSPKVSSSIMDRVSGGGAEAPSTPAGGRTPGNLTPAGRTLYGRLGKEGRASGGREIGASGMFDTSPGVKKGGGSWTPTPVRAKKAES